MAFRHYLLLGLAATAVVGSAYLAPAREPESLDLFGTETRMKERRIDIESDIMKAKSYLAYCKDEDAEKKYDGVRKLQQQMDILEETKRSAHVWKFPDLEERVVQIEGRIGNHLNYHKIGQNLKNTK